MFSSRSQVELGRKVSITNTTSSHGLQLALVSGEDLEIYEWWGYVIFARENLRPRPLLLPPRPLYAH